MGTLTGEQGILPGTPFPFAAVFLPLGWEWGGSIFSVCGDLVVAAPKANPTRSPILGFSLQFECFDPRLGPERIH